jgi:hypothetical protein
VISSNTRNIEPEALSSGGEILSTQLLGAVAEVNMHLWSTRRIGLMQEPLNVASERSSLGAMSAWELAEQCEQEMSHFRWEDPSSDLYAVELFRRATSHGDQEAWAEVQHCFGESVRSWLRQHPNREAACHLDNEEHYVALAFERFWQATTSQKLEFGQLSAVLLYLRACLNGVMVDTLRAYSQLKKISLQEPDEPGKPPVKDSTESDEVWELLKALLLNEREQRLAYLLYRCGLGPREIVHCYPQEWSDVQEITRLRRTILERVLGNANQLRW